VNPTLSRNRDRVTPVTRKPERRPENAHQNRRGNADQGHASGLVQVQILRLVERLPMRKYSRVAARLLALTLIIAGFITGSLAAGLAPAGAQTSTAAARTAAAKWLVGRLDPTTHLLPGSSPTSPPDFSGTVYLLSNAALAGVSDPALDAAYAAVQAQAVTGMKDRNGADLPGALARTIIAVVARGGDPTSFGGTNLVSRLQATLQPSGLYGVQSGTYDAAFRQGLALAALSLVPGSDTKAGVAWLQAQQCGDGSWMPSRPDLTQPCAPDATLYISPDSNSTAMAILGLKAVGATPTIDPLPILLTIRLKDGGWGFDATATAADPDSTGLVMAALRSLGQTPDTAAVNALLHFQFGADTGPDQGAFWYPPYQGAPAPSVLATNDAILGLSGLWPATVRPTVTTTTTTTSAVTTTTSTAVATTTTAAVTTTTTGVTSTSAATTTAAPRAMVQDLTTSRSSGTGSGTVTGSLARTGTDTLPMVAWAVGLIVAGLGLAVVARRRA
jgi:hypothetical protein